MPKYTTPHLTPPTLLEFLALSLTNILPSPTNLHLSPMPVTITFIDVTVCPYLDLSTAWQPVPLLHVSFTPNLITTILVTINFISLNYPVSSRSRILARTVVKAPKSCHITPITRSLHWLRTTERIECKLLLLSYKILTTTQPPYYYNLISVQRPCSTRSSSVVTLARPPTSSSLNVTDRSFRYASTLSLESALFISSSTSFW